MFSRFTDRARKAMNLADVEAAVEEVLARELPTTRKDVLQRVAGAIVKLFDPKVSEPPPDNSGSMPPWMYDLSVNPNLGVPCSPSKSDYDLMVDKIIQSQGVAGKTFQPVWTARQPDPHMPDELKLGRHDASQDSWVVVRGHWCHHSSATADTCREVLAGAYSDQVKTMYSERLAELEGAADIPQVAMTNEELYPPGDQTSHFTTVLASDSPREAFAKLNSGCGGVLFLDEVTKLDIDDRTILQVLVNGWVGAPMVGFAPSAPVLGESPPEVCSKCGIATGLACHNCEGITPVCANCECPKCGK